MSDWSACSGMLSVFQTQRSQHRCGCVVPGKNIRFSHLQEIIDPLCIRKIFRNLTFQLPYHKLFSIEQPCRKGGRTWTFPTPFIYSLPPSYSFRSLRACVLLPAVILKRFSEVSQHFVLPPLPSPFPFPLVPNCQSSSFSHGNGVSGEEMPKNEWGRAGREATAGKWNNWNKMFWTAGLKRLPGNETSPEVHKLPLN